VDPRGSVAQDVSVDDWIKGLKKRLKLVWVLSRILP
jgi:hypothetical protein